MVYRTIGVNIREVDVKAQRQTIIGLDIMDAHLQNAFVIFAFAGGLRIEERDQIAHGMRKGRHECASR